MTREFLSDMCFFCIEPLVFYIEPLILDPHVCSRQSGVRCPHGILQIGSGLATDSASTLPRSVKSYVR